ncbi:hypothetical protein, partial [Sutterella massiliensis]|uniref:hypothetical protein n=1 Tax=Sutterella massiliensis TaxID=1816689 RepID=UPI001961A9BF
MTYTSRIESSSEGIFVNSLTKRRPTRKMPHRRLGNERADFLGFSGSYLFVFFGFGTAKVSGPFFFDAAATHRLRREFLPHPVAST